MKLRLLVGIVGMLMLANIAAAKPFAYVLNRGSSYNASTLTGSVSVVDMGVDPASATNPIVGTITVGKQPYSLVVSPKGGKLYVANQGDINNKTDQSLMIIDTDTLQVLAPTVGVPITYQPGGMALNKAETRLFVADQDNSRVYVYDLNGSTLNPTPIGYVDASDNTGLTKPEGIALDEPTALNGYVGRLYVVKSLTDKVAVFDLALLEDDAKSATKGSSFIKDIAMPTNASPVAVAVANGKAYVSCPGSNNVAIINSATLAAEAPLSLDLNYPYGITANADGSKIYVANTGNQFLPVFSYLTSTLARTTITNPSATQTTEFVAESADPLAVNSARYVLVNSFLNKITANNSSIILVNGAGTPKTVTVGINPGSIGDFMGPKLPWTLTTSVSPAASGTVTPSLTVGATTVLAAEGAYKTFKTTPNGTTHKSVLSVTVSDGVTPVSYGAAEVFTVGPITKNLTIAVAFDTIATKYPLTTNILGGGNCTVSYSGITNPIILPPATTGAIEYPVGTLAPTVQVTVTAVQGSSFDGWSICSSASTNTCTVSTMASPGVTIEAICSVLPPCSDFLRGPISYDGLGDSCNAGGDSLIKVTAIPSKSTTPVEISGTQSVKIDGGYDLCGTKLKGAGVISTLSIGSLTISTTGTVEISEIAIK